MSTTRSARTVAPSSSQPARGKRSWHVADFLLPVSVCLWAVGVTRTNVTALGPFGLLSDLPLIFYAGVALLVVSAAAELAHHQPSTWRMAAHAVALVIMLYGTFPLLFPEPRSSWAYEYVGVVEYVGAHGHLNPAVDIFQNWPGFFALAAWFTKLAGLSSPLVLAKWSEVFFELAALPLLYLIYKALPLTNRQLWVAILLYSASNWVGQDSFTDQAVGTLLSLGIMAIAMRWLFVDPPARVPVWGWLRSRRTDRSAAADLSIPPTGRSIPVIVAILVMFFVLTFTHEISPYMVVTQLGALAVVGALRPRWLPLALAAIALAYFLPHWSFVNSHYGLTRTLGDFFKNAALPSAHVGAAPSERWIERSAEALSLGIWALAAVGAWLRRRAGQDALPLVLLAFSPFLVLVLAAYGQEGILRVFLFSLPWSAALGACALLPPLREAGRTGVSRGHVPKRTRMPPWTAERGRLRVLSVPIGLGIALILFFPSAFGNTAFEAIPRSEVVTITSFFAHATPGTIYTADARSPIEDNARYDQFPERTIFGSYNVMGDAPVGPEMADVLASHAFNRHGPEAGRPAYVVVAPSMQAWSNAYQVTPASSFRILLASLSHSPYWRLVRSRGGTVIYELLPPRSPTLPPGASG
jgi:branched-subunit amino acid transport protein AzlD